MKTDMGRKEPSEASVFMPLRMLGTDIIFQVLPKLGTITGNETDIMSLLTTDLYKTKGYRKSQRSKGLLVQV